jgi:hypothetical protein
LVWRLTRAEYIASKGYPALGMTAGRVTKKRPLAIEPSLNRPTPKKQKTQPNPEVYEWSDSDKEGSSNKENVPPVKDNGVGDDDVVQGSEDEAPLDQVQRESGAEEILASTLTAVAEIVATEDANANAAADDTEEEESDTEHAGGVADQETAKNGDGGNEGDEEATEDEADGLQAQRK